MENLLNLLESHYPTEKSKMILQAISIDPLILSMIEQDDFISRYWEVNQNSDTVWQAADIAAFAAMYYQVDEENGPGNPEESLAFIGKQLHDFTENINSADAEEIMKTISSEGNHEISGRILSFAYGTVENKLQYLTKLGNFGGSHLVVNAILQHEFNEDARLDRLSAWIKNQPASVVDQTYRLLCDYGISALANEIVAFWMQHNQSQVQEIMDGLTSEELSALADLYAAVKNDEKKAQMLEKAQKKLQEQVEYVQYLQFKNHADPSGKFTEKGIVKTEVPKSYQVAYLLENDQIQPSDAAEFSAGVKENPLAAIRLAGTLLEQSPDEARTLAEEALLKLKQQDMQFEQYLPKTVQQWQPAMLLETLNQLHMAGDTARLGKAILNRRPNDMAVVQQMVIANQELKHWREAEVQARLRYINDPADQGSIQNLATVYEKSERWQKAYSTWKLALKKNKQADSHLIMHTMQAAVESGHPKDAIKIFDALPEAQNQQADILHQYGNAFRKLDDPANAEKAYLQGTRQNAANGNNWLALSELYRKQGQKNKSIETLKTAAVHAPENTQILVSLANLYLENHDMETARKLMKQAVLKDDMEYQTGLDMLSNLEQLQEHQLFNEYAGKLQQRWPDDGELAYRMAKSCLALGKKTEGLRSFEAAAHVEHPSVQWLLDYAVALVDNGKEVFEETKNIPLANYVKALQLLEDADSRESDLPASAKLLQGELNLEIGRYEKAYKVYKTLSDMLGNLSPAEVNRFQTGLGTSAHYAGENETALAALKAAGKDSEHPMFVYQRTAEAYRELQFADEAIQAAKSALSAGPTQLNNLAWFAEFAISMDATDEAKEALAVATELAPDDVEHAIAYAVILAKLQDWETFDDTMAKIRQFPRLNEQQRLKIADLYLDIHEEEHALDFLKEGALSLDQNEISGAYLLTNALIAYKQGSLAESTTLVQQVLEKRDWDAGLHTLFGDLLAKQEKYRAASASYDHAEKVAVLEEGRESIFDSLSAQLKSLFSTEWIDSLYNQSSIAARSAAIDINEKRYEEAATRAKSLLNPELHFSDETLFQLGLSAYLLQNDELLAKADDTFKRHLDEEACKNARLHTLAAEMALQANDSVSAGKYLFANLQATEKDWWTASIQGRLLLLNGDWLRAGELFEENYRQFTTPDDTDDKVITRLEEGVSIITERDLQAISLIHNAVALRDWEKVVILREQLSTKAADLPLIGLTLIQTDLETVEFKRIGMELQISSHVPDDSVYQEAGYSRCMATLTAIKPGLETETYKRLVNRIQLVYRPSLQTIRDIVQLVPDEKDIRYLVPAVRRLDHCQGVAQLAQKAAKDSDVLMNVALCSLGQHPDESISILTAALNVKPDDPVYCYALSLAFEQAGKTQDAYDAVNRALGIWTDEAMWHMRAAELAEKSQKQPVSHGHYAKAYQIAPGNAQVADRYVKNLIAMEDFQKAYEILEQAQQADPEDWNLDLMMADIYEKVGEYDNALVELERAVEKSSGDSSAKIRMARVLINNRAYQEAYDLLKSIPTDKEPAEEMIYLHAAALHGLGKEKQASNMLEKYLSTHAVKNDAMMVEYVKIVRKLQGDRTAIAYAEDILSRFPESAETCAMLADMHYECGEVEDAAKYLEKGLALNNRHAGMNYINGVLAKQQGNLDLAVHSFVTTIQQDAACVDAYKLLSEVHLRRREYDEAAKVMKQGIDANPQALSLLLDASKIFKDSKDYAEAENMLRKAAALKPDDVNIQRQLGAIIALNLVHNQ